MIFCHSRLDRESRPSPSSSWLCPGSTSLYFRISRNSFCHLSKKVTPKSQPVVLAIRLIKLSFRSAKLPRCPSGSNSWLRSANFIGSLTLGLQGLELKTITPLLHQCPVGRHPELAPALRSSQSEGRDSGSSCYNTSVDLM